MIVGIGIDLVECGRFLDWSAFKKQRIFTKKELEYADNDNANAESIWLTSGRHVKPV